MARIELSGVAKKYPGSTAVANMDLTIEDGELLVFLGPSGCGKTTTMNMIAGLTTPTSGKILFDAQDVTAVPPHQRNSAMVFQSSLLYPHLTARKNIMMSLRHSGLAQDAKRERVDNAARIVNVERLLDKMPSQLSGGERQRVATAKAIVRQPSVFLLDEPFAALDAALRMSIRAELVNLQKRLGTTMVIVTHDQVEAMTMGDRIAVMQAGELQQIGTPNEIYRRPANLFVAGFIGSPPMNFFEGAVADGGSRFASPFLSLDLPVGPVPAGGLIMGVRPHDIVLTFEPQASLAIYAIEHLGNESVVIVESADGVKFRGVMPPDFEYPIGTKVSLSAPRATPLLFDARTGQALPLRG